MATVIAVALVLAAAVGWWAFVRSVPPRPRSLAGRPAAATREAADAEAVAVDSPAQWGVRVVAAVGQVACPPVRQCLGAEFTLGAKPSLPLPDCPFPSQCKCSYVKLYDRRSQTRRSGYDRRVNGHRLGEGHVPRRSGIDRRGKRVDWL
ncbi:MAG: hypothetical protein MUE59_13735 [Thiobacillaceae bacterium]|nr:hypothetical protein [Thiobacillaceae bacterium]